MAMEALKRLFVDTKLVVHALVCVFAISSWVDINGMWVELPILVTNLPEQWGLPSYIIVISQVANVGPVVFFILANCVGKTRAYKSTLDKVTSYAIMLVGLTATFLLAFLWSRTGEVAGQERSIALLALSFCLAVMDCTSSMAFTAFMAVLKPSYLPSYFFGEGLSGLIPALLALGQGAGEIVCVNGSSTREETVNGSLGTNASVVNVTDYFVYPKYLPPRFSVQVFFLLLSGLIGLSIICFSLINYWGYCKDQFVHKSSYNLSQDTGSGQHEKQRSPDDVHALQYLNSNKAQELGNTKDAPERGVSNGAAAGEKPTGGAEGKQSDGEGSQKVSKGEVAFLLIQVVVINFLITSFLLSIQVYSSLPYGISNYNLVVTLSNIANPVACAISIFFAVTSPYVITAVTTLGVACGAYIIVAASMSPTPPLVGTMAGGAIAVVIWVGASFFLTLGKISVAGVMRKVGRRALIWYGAATQIGALVGALTGFVLVNEIKVFKDASWC